LGATTMTECPDSRKWWMVWQRRVTVPSMLGRKVSVKNAMRKEWSELKVVDRRKRAEGLSFKRYLDRAAMLASISLNFLV